MKYDVQGLKHNKLWGGYSRPGSPNSVHDCYYQCASNDPKVPQLWAYTDSLSYSPGSSINLHINTTAPGFDVLIYRDGAEQKVVYQKVDVQGQFVSTAGNCSVNGCNWPIALNIAIGPDWSSGGYIIECNATATDGSELSYAHIFLVCPDKESDKKQRLLLVASTGTWTAYNDWGGSNAYEGITGPLGNLFSPVLSHERPFSRGFVKLPSNAPRIPLREPPKMGAKVTYPHMEWAYENGFSKKYASSGWASYEKHYVQWLETAGYAVDIIAQHDLQYQPELVGNYNCLTFIGHDEYWSWEMRDTIDNFVNQGGNIARFAGNFLWQTRLENDGKTQICYKYRAREEDPIHQTENVIRTTNAWESPEVGRPGAQTFGLNAILGMYAGWGGCTPRGAGGFTVYRPDHWAFKDCDIYYGDILGAPSKVFGYEVDGVDYVVKNGLPYATGMDGAPVNLVILAVGLATLFESDHGNGSELFIGSEDAEFAAMTLDGDVTSEKVDRFKRGSGMIALFEKGKGCVFTAGTCEWVAGLIDCDPQVERVTKNVLNRFLEHLI
jgi:hypothetical protein